MILQAVVNQYLDGLIPVDVLRQHYYSEFRGDWLLLGSVAASNQLVLQHIETEELRLCNPTDLTREFPYVHIPR